MPTAKHVGSKAVASGDKLFRRERQVMAYAAALATEVSAFRRVSISFVAKKSSVKSLLYLAPLKDEEPANEEDGEVEDDDMGEPAPAPASASAEREQAPAPPSAAKSKHSKQVGPSGPSTSTSAPKRVLSGTPSGGKKVVDKNALSARGSPKGEHYEQQPHVSSSGTRDGDGSTPRGKAKSPLRTPCYPPWRSPMLKAHRGPPPPDPARHGKYVNATTAGLEYGNPLRLVWVRTADHKVWETDARDGDHLGGFHREDKDLLAGV